MFRVIAQYGERDNYGIFSQKKKEIAVITKSAVMELDKRYRHKKYTKYVSITYYKGNLRVLRFELKKPVSRIDSGSTIIVTCTNLEDINDG